LPHNIAPKAKNLSFLALSTWVRPEAVLAVGRHRLQVPIKCPAPQGKEAWENTWGDFFVGNPAWV